MTRSALHYSEGIVTFVEDGTNPAEMSLFEAIDLLRGRRVWITDINTAPESLAALKLLDATTAANVLGIFKEDDPDAPPAAPEALLDWVADFVDPLDDDEYDDLRITVEQQRVWWHSTRRGFRLDPAAMAAAQREADYQRFRAKTLIGTDISRDDDARQFLDDHGIRIPPPMTDAEDDTIPSTVSHRHWHRAVVPDGAEEAWLHFQEIRNESATHGQLWRMAHQGTTGRLPTHWRISGARTGRMASSRFAMQNIPKSLRTLFLADEGKVFLKCDLDRAEPSVAAWLSGDEALRDDLVAGDVYQGLGDRIGVDRGTAKIVFLSLLYGKGIARLAFDLDIEVEEAAEIKEELLAAYPDLRRWMRRTLKNAERGNGVTNGFGRWSPLPRREAYKAVNTAAQGTAAGVLVRMVDNVIEHPLLGADTLWLAVHDELILQVPEADTYDDVLAAFATCMRFEVDGVTIAGTPELLGSRWTSA